MTVTIYPGDNRAWLAALKEQGAQFHSVVTDPPYGLVSIKKRFGSQTAAPAKHGTDGAFARASRGFMGKEWDGTGIENDPAFWLAVLDVMLPGAYCFAFSGTRTVHRQMIAMEDAGFILHPLHIWAFGSGFPKAHAADKAIDKMLGASGEIVPTGAPVKRMIPGADQHKNGWKKNDGREYKPGEYVAATPEAQRWAGWAYGTQSQKPALEPIVLAQKPFSEKTGAANILRHGVGAVNIDGCRVPADSDAPRATRRGGFVNSYEASKNDWGAGDSYTPNQAGRHPANLLHDGSDAVTACFPNDNARYFHTFSADEQGVYYHPKASKADRADSKHPTVKPIALMQHLIRHITPPGGAILDPFAGSGTTGEAARREGFDCALMEREPEYLEFLYERFHDA